MSSHFNSIRSWIKTKVFLIKATLLVVDRGLNLSAVIGVVLYWPKIQLGLAW